MIFFLGVVCGIAIVILYALWLAAKPKPVTPAANGISTCSVSMSGDQTPEVVQIDKQMLEKILRAHGADKLGIIHTRH
jgi:hypothetical protein